MLLHQETGSDLACLDVTCLSERRVRLHHNLGALLLFIAVLFFHIAYVSRPPTTANGAQTAAVTMCTHSLECETDVRRSRLIVLAVDNKITFTSTTATLETFLPRMVKIS